MSNDRGEHSIHPEAALAVRRLPNGRPCVIRHPDRLMDAEHGGSVDAIRNVPELVLEFISRPDYIAMYLGVVGLWCLSLSFRGLRMESTKAFGWRSGDVTGDEAKSVGRAWLVIASGLLASGTGLWFAS